MATIAPWHWLKIKVVDPDGPEVSCLLDEGTATPVADGGWEVVPRPQRKAGTEWVGYAPYMLSVDVKLEGFQEERSVEPEHETLRRIMRVPRPPLNEPPTVRLTGHVRHLNLRYVLQNIDYRPGAELREDGHAVRLPLTLTFLEYVPLDVVTIAVASPAAQAVTTAPAATAAAAAAPAAGAAAGRTYTVAAGDTLSRIAARMLGNVARYPEIATLNGIRDPNRISVGQVLQIPAA